MKQSTRPPAQYLTAPGTQFRLIPNEYDKNTYAQCNYASYRTLIRCKQIRSKEELSRNEGKCEEHVEFSKILEKNHKKEISRCHAENDSKMQRRRFDPWIASNERISDEEDYLQPVQTVPTELPDAVNDNLLDNHPLRYAGHFTDKDVLQIKMDLVQQDIDDLMEFRELLTCQAQKDHEVMGDDEETDRPNDLPQRRIFNAAARYDRNDYLTLTTVDPVYSQCCVGPNMDDSLVVSHVIHSILNKIDNLPIISADEKCVKPTLHSSLFCIDHITLDRSQKLFGYCRDCGATSINLEKPKCTFHLKKNYTDSNSTATTTCPCDRCVHPNEVKKSPAATKRQASSSLDMPAEEDLANLSRIESMVSPMQQFGASSPTPFTSNIRKYQGPPAQVLRPPQMGPPPGGPIRPILGTSSPAEEEEASQTCARVRPIDPSQYGSGKKRQQRTSYQQQQQRNSPATYYSSYQNKKMSTMASPLNSPGRSSNVPYQGYRSNQTGGHRPMYHGSPMSATRYPVSQQRVPHQPKTIPLERLQDPISGGEDGESSSTSSAMSSRLPTAAEVPRRGVPYYKAQSFRRSDLPSRHSSASHPPPPQPPPPSSGSPQPPLSHHPLPPTQNPFRSQTSRYPMPPHRAIAAGLNPADVGVAPRNRIPQVRQQYLARPGPQRLAAGGGGSITTSYTVVGNPTTSSSSTPSSSSMAISALNSAFHDARFAQINVKTFLTMNKDLKSMTQEEIDLLLSANSSSTTSHEKSPRKNAPQQPAPARKPDPGPAQAPPLSEPLGPPPPAETIPAKKRKVEENPEATSPAGDVVKKTTPQGKRASVEKETAKPPKSTTPAKRSSPTPPTSSSSSGRTPRAAAIAANQAISHQKTTTASSTSTTPSVSAASSSQENPLDLLAELSEAAAAAEEKQMETPATSSSSAKRANRKTPRKSPAPPAPPPSSSSSTSQKKKRSSSEDSEEL